MEIPPLDYIEKLIYERQRAVLMEITITGVRLKDEFWGDLYLSKDKSYNIVGGEFYNGRVLSADALTCVVTEIDYMILRETYQWDSIEVLQLYKAPKGKLPRCIIDYIIEQYRYKTSLKGVEDELSQTLYMKSKNRLNGIYGLFATAPIREEIVYTAADRDFHYDKEEDITSIFERCKSGYWLPYQFGVWCTALARYELYKGIRQAAYDERRGVFTDFIYCDTDSVKYLGEVDWSAYNAEKIRLSTESGAFADDAKGKRHYMGVYEDEGSCRFKSVGSKKYAYEKDGKMYVTIAGVDKRKGAKELQARGGLEALEDGFVFREAGGLCAKYNDIPTISKYVIEGHEIEITSNLYLCASEYTVGTLEIYKRIIQMSHIYIDKVAEELYNDGVLKRE